MPKQAAWDTIFEKSVPKYLQTPLSPISAPQKESAAALGNF
jgi:hypothetical protein